MTLSLATAASGILRDGHFALNPGTGLYERTTLIEKAFTNRVSAALSAWTTDGTVNRTSGQSDPSGGTGAYLLEDADAAVTADLWTSPYLTGDGTKSVRIFLKQGTSADVGVALYDQTAATQRHRIKFTWSTLTAATVVGSGRIEDVIEVGGGWYELSFTAENAVAANTNRVYVYPCATSPSSTGTVYVYEPAVFDDTTGPVPGTVVAASDTKDADVAYQASGFDWTPQQATGYYRFIEAGGIYVVDGVVAHGGSSTPGEDPRIVVKSTGTYYQAIHDNGTTVSTSTATAAPTVGQLVELRVGLGSDGAIQLHQSINEAAEADYSAGSAATLQAAWAGTRHYLGSEAGSDGGLLQLTRAGWFQGDVALSELRAWAGA